MLVTAIVGVLTGGCAADTPTGTQTPAAMFPPAVTAGTAGTAGPFLSGPTAGTGSQTQTLPPPVAPTLPKAGTGAAAGGGTVSMAGKGGASAASAGMSTGSAGLGTGSAGTGTAGNGTGTAGLGAIAGTGSPTAGTMGTRTCCPDGNCLCHGDVPAQITGKGPYKTAQIRASTGTVVYPTDADPPLAALSITPGFLNTGPEMADWGPFLASYGLVTVITSAGSADIPAIRAGLLLGSIEELKKMNTDSKSPLFGKLSDRYGTSGYSFGGGGATIAASDTQTLNSTVGLATFGGAGTGKVPTLLLCGDADTVAGCLMSDSVYGSIPESTPKMMITVPGATHFNWFGPGDTTDQMSGKYALAFQKVYLEGDTRWKALLLQKPASGTVKTNIK